MLLGLIVAGVLYVGLAWLVEGHARAPAPTSRPTVASIIEHEVELDEPEPPPEPEPEPPEAPAPTDSAPRRVSKNQPQRAPRDSAEPPPLAQAGRVLASDSPAETLDFTGFDIATGDGEGYAGGVTASDGTSAEAVHEQPEVDAPPPEPPPPERDLSQPVTLEARAWRCPWPREASALGVDEQVVVLRVVVGRLAGSISFHCQVEATGIRRRPRTLLGSGLRFLHWKLESF